MHHPRHGSQDLPDRRSSKHHPIGESAFYGCAGLNPVDLPNLTEMNDSVFAYSGVPSIILSDRIRSIGRGTFLGTNIKEITLPGSLEYLGVGAFHRAWLLSHVTLPESLTEIPDSAYRYCKNLKSIKFPPRLRTIGNSAFERSGLSTLDLPVFFDL